MKNTKMITLAASALLTVGLLGACSSDNTKDTAASSEQTTATSAADVVSTASISDNVDVLTKALSADGNWLVALTNDVTFDKDVTVAGNFHDKNDEANPVYRKLALYDQDDKYVVTAEYTLTVPKLIVETENFNIVNGKVKGDIEVKANGFVLNGTEVDGNITFAKQEYKDSAVLDQEGAKVNGEITVAE